MSSGKGGGDVPAHSSLPASPMQGMIRGPVPIALLVTSALLVAGACGGDAAEDTTVTPDTSVASLRAELIAMGESDQSVRQGLTMESAADTILIARVAQVDSANTARLTELVEQYGWPLRSRVGEEAAQAAFLVVQHSPSHEFQKRMLEALGEAAELGEADRSDVAMLMDRVLIHEGRPQLYGTQFRIEDGRLVPYPIADVEGVDAARAAMGLMPMSEYVEALRQTYQGPVEWQPEPDSAADTLGAATPGR